jgi:hypothetical protein
MEMEDGVGGGLEETPVRVEETRRRVEMMAVDENEQAGGILRSTVWLGERRMGGIG